MSIDTSTTAGKIAVMQAFEDGRLIQSQHVEVIDGVWESTTLPVWQWHQYIYRIKPQTVEEAAKEYRQQPDSEPGALLYYKLDTAFKAGAQWQKDQDNE